jgi:uncharacterized protein YraI
VQEPNSDAPPQQDGVAFVLTFANLRLRSLPTVNAPALQTIPQGTTVRASGRDAGVNWLLVEYRGVTGWVSSLYVRTSDNLSALPVRDGTDPNASPPPPASQSTALDGTVVGSGTMVIFSNEGNVNIRVEPNVDSPRLGQIPLGTRVDVILLDPTYSWGQVDFGGVQGWVALWAVNTLGDLRTVEVVGNPGSGSDLPLPSGPNTTYSEEQRAVVQTAQVHLGRYVPNASTLIGILNNGANNGFISCGPVIPYFRPYRPSDFDIARVPELATVRDNINAAFDSLNRARAHWLIACTGDRTLLFSDQYPAWLAIAQGGLPSLEAAESLVAELSAR